MNERAALEVFASLGIATAQSRVLPIAGPIPDDIVYPVVAKVLSEEIAHKSDVGGVVVGIDCATALAAARTRILASLAAHLPGVTAEGILVQTMHRGLAEAIVGFHDDPLAGPVVMVGMGGILAEIYRDVAVRLAPVTIDTARQMVAGVKGFAALRGARGQAKGDLEALAGVIVALSSLATTDGPLVAAAEINPVLVGSQGQGAVAVDGLIHRLGAETPHG